MLDIMLEMFSGDEVQCSDGPKMCKDHNLGYSTSRRMRIVALICRSAQPDLSRGVVAVYFHFGKQHMKSVYFFSQLCQVGGISDRLRVLGHGASQWLVGRSMPRKGLIPIPLLLPGPDCSRQPFHILESIHMSVIMLWAVQCLCTPVPCCFVLLCACSCILRVCIVFFNQSPLSVAHERSPSRPPRGAPPNWRARCSILVVSREYKCNGFPRSDCKRKHLPFDVFIARGAMENCH